MIEISLGKLVLLALIALIVLGPEKLPGAARTAGALLRRVRSGWDNVRAEVERELEIEEIKRIAREAAAHAEAAQGGLQESLQQVRAPFAEAAARITSTSSITSETTAAEISGAARDSSTSSAEQNSLGNAAHDDPAVNLQAELPLGEPVLPAPTARNVSHDQL